MVIALCGMTGGGKTEAGKFFAERGFTSVHLGVTEEVMRVYGRTNEELEKEMRNKWRSERGMGVMAEINLTKIKQILSNGDKPLIENMYSWSEYKIFHQTFGTEFITIAIHASPKQRYLRLASRDIRPQDAATSKQRDYSEIEQIEKGGPIAMADYHVVNDGDKDNLYAQLEVIFQQISKNVNLN